MGDLPCFLRFLLDPCTVLSFLDFFRLTLGFDFFDATGEGLREIELYLGTGNCSVSSEAEEISSYCSFSFSTESSVLGRFLCFFCLWDDFLPLL